MSSREKREIAFTEFAQARTATLHRSAWLLCRDEHEAHDLVQETLTKVYVMWMRPLARIDNPVAYAHTTLTRTFLSSRRKRSSTEVPVDEFDERSVEDTSATTTERLVAQEALARLSAVDRAIVVARYVDDLSAAEVAAMVSLSPGAVRIRAMRALEKLRTWLGEAADPEPEPAAFSPSTTLTRPILTTEEAHA